MASPVGVPAISLTHTCESVTVADGLPAGASSQVDTSLVASWLAHHSPRFTGSPIQQSLMIRDATKNLASQFAKEIEANLSIVSRVRQPDVWQMIQEKQKED